MSGTRATRVLLVEDEAADIEFTQYAFDGGALDHQLTVCQTGRKAVEHVARTKGTDDYPDLVLLDINLPDMTGIEVIEAIRQDPSNGCLPIIVLSTSSYGADVLESYRSSANAYVQKPLRLAAFEELVRSIELFWFDQAILPSRSGPGHAGAVQPDAE